MSHLTIPGVRISFRPVKWLSRDLVRRHGCYRHQAGLAAADAGFQALLPAVLRVVCASAPRGEWGPILRTIVFAAFDEARAGSRPTLGAGAPPVARFTAALFRFKALSQQGWGAVTRARRKVLSLFLALVLAWTGPWSDSGPAAHARPRLWTTLAFFGGGVSS
jgi:hypothetical protein